MCNLVVYSNSKEETIKLGLCYSVDKGFILYNIEYCAIFHFLNVEVTSLTHPQRLVHSAILFVFGIHVFICYFFKQWLCHVYSNTTDILIYFHNDIRVSHV